MNYKHTSGLIFCLSVSLCFMQMAEAQRVYISAGASCKTNGNAYICIKNAGFVNNGSFSASTGSTLTMSGTSRQSIGGSSSSSFNNLVIDNDSGISLENNETVTGILTLMNGRLLLGSSNLTLGPSAVAGNLSASNMIVTNGTGECRRSITSNGSYTFPVGDITGTAEYSPVTLSFSSGVYSDGMAGVRVINAKHPNNASSANYLNRYWKINSTGISSFSCTVTGAYTSADISGTEGNQAAGKYGGSLPWTKYSVMGSNTLTAAGVSGFGDFTGITAAPPAVSLTALPATTVCRDSSLSLTADPTGDPSFTYSWSPGGASTKTIHPLTNTAGTTEYTVTATDGNGFTATKNVTVTVNERKKISGVFTYYNTSNTLLIGADITVNLYKSSDLSHSIPIGTDVTDAAGYYEFSSLCPECDYDIVATSNHTTESAVNTTDAAQVNWFGTHPYLIEKVRFHAGDVGTAGTPSNLTIQATDAARIQNHFVYDTPFDNTWTFWKAGDAINSASTTDSWPKATLVAGNDLTVNMYGLCTGDFNRSYDPSIVKSASATLDLIETGNISAAASQEIELPVSIAETSEIGAISLILNYPSEYVEILDVTIPGAGGQLDWAVKGDELRIGWNSAVPLYLAAGSELIILKLKTTDAFTAGKIARFTLASNPLNELADGLYQVIGNSVLGLQSVEAGFSGIDLKNDNYQVFLANYPNPFSDFTMIKYVLPFDGRVSLKINSLQGITIMDLEDKMLLKGEYEVRLNTDGLKPGAYTATVKLKSANDELIKTIKLIKN